MHTARRYAETGDARLIWEGHMAGRHIGYCHIEKLHNLEQLPSAGFVVSCFPVKIERASAGWTRAVAILDAARLNDSCYAAASAGLSFRQATPSGETP